MKYSTLCSLSASKNQKHPSKNEFSKCPDQVYPVLDEHRLLSNLWIVFRSRNNSQKELSDEVELGRLPGGVVPGRCRGLEQDP